MKCTVIQFDLNTTDLYAMLDGQPVYRIYQGVPSDLGKNDFQKLNVFQTKPEEIIARLP